MRLGLGTAQFGLYYGIANKTGRTSLAAAAAILARARAAGIDTIDTAIAYGDSEQCLGTIGVAGWRVVSKLPAVPDDSEDVAAWIADAVEGSLRRLRADSLHGLLLHRPEQLRSERAERIHAAMTELRASGRVRKIGFSIYDPGELDELWERYPPDLVQAPFSILDRRLVESGWLSRLRGRGVEVHVRSIFLQGLLLMEAGSRPPRFQRWRSIWKRWDEWLALSGLTPLQACVGYALSEPAIDRIIIGVDSVQQLEEIVRVVERNEPVPVPDDLRVDDPALLNPANWTALS